MLFIDLDNTIYNQKIILDYVFLKIGEFIENNFNISKTIIKDYLMKITKEKTLKCRIFDFLIKEFNLEIYPEEIVDVYRKKTIEYLNKNKIKIYRDVLELFNTYNDIIVYTEGNSEIQKLKIKNIQKNYKIKIKYIVVKDKLSEENIKIFEKYNPTIYIGDDVFSDFYIPNKLGIFTIRVLRGLYKNISNNIVDIQYRPKICVKRLRKNILIKK